MSLSPERIDPASSGTSIADFATANVRVPPYVVYRDFAHETVMLNLRTGKYHGLNPSAGAMLDVLEKAPTVSDAIDQIANRYGKEPAEVEQDVYEFCIDLLDRSLIELGDVSA